MVFKSIKNRIPGIILSIIGGLFILLTRFSKHAWLDPDNTLGLQDWWGKRHYFLLILGVLLSPSCLYVTYSAISRPINEIAKWFTKKYPRLLHLCKFMDIYQSNNIKYPIDSKALLLWLSTIVPVILLAIHSMGIIVIGWKTIRLVDIKLHEPNLYMCWVRGADQNTNILQGSPVYLYENEKVLTKSFSIARARVRNNLIAPDYQVIEYCYFTPSDNSNPTTSEYNYTIKYPLSLPFFAIDLLFFIGFVGTIIFSVRYRYSIYGFIQKPPLYLPIILWSVAFALNRLWLLIDYPLAAIHPDSGSYFAVSELIGTGVWPLFNIRSIGYPLILKMVFIVSDRVMSLVLFQNLLSYIAGIAVVIATYRWKCSLGLLASISMIALFSSVTSMESDTAMLSESPYTSFLVISFALLLHAFSRSGWWGSFACSAFFMAASLLIRPNGMFLFVTFLMIVIYMLWNKYSSRLILIFVAPFVLIVTSMCVYNYITINVFSVTAWGEANLATATFTFWEKDESYPREVNDSIDKIKSILDQRFKETGIDPARLYYGWDHEYLSSIFVQGFNGRALDVSMLLGGKFYDRENRQWIRKISFDSIKKHPYIYFKFVVTMLRNYYTMPGEGHFSAYLLNRIKLIYIDHHFSARRGIEVMVKMGKEFADSPPPKTVIINENIDPQSELSKRVALVETPLLHAYNITCYLKRLLFTSQIWIFGFFVVMVTSFVKLVASRFRDNAAFIMFILTISNLGASLVVSLVEYSQPRYSYPMEWIYYYSVLVGIPLLLPENLKNYFQSAFDIDDTSELS